MEEYTSSRGLGGLRKRKDVRKGKGSHGSGGNKTKNKKKLHSKKKTCAEANDGKRFQNNPDAVAHTKHPSLQRKKVDPETAKYFLEVATLFESNTIELEERPSVCANALEEARGKEVELATDMVISRTLQTLIEGSELEQVYCFLQGCAASFPSISMDRYGSHVVESAFKSLSLHLRDMQSHAVIEDILTNICKVVAVDPVNMMCNCYGSHVVRSLLCLCKGISLDSLEELHSTKTSKVFTDRLCIKAHHQGGGKLIEQQEAFPDLLKRFILEMLKHSGSEVKAIRVDKYGCFVLQVALKLLRGYDRESTHAILLLLGHSDDSIDEGLSFKSVNSREILGLLEDTSGSHLFEVILEVAPDDLYDKILQNIFRGSLFELSSHHCGNFVIQALLSYTRSKGQVNIIWEEIGSKMKSLLESGKVGVIASLMAACHRLEIRRRECCKVLAQAVHPENESYSSIVPRLLFLDSFLCCSDKSTWQWPLDSKMHVLGCLILQTVFRFPSQYMQLYAKSLASLDDGFISKMAEDAGGSRVLESFLSSDVSAKVKLKVISKLQGHFGVTSLHPSGSFSVEKCFAASNLYFREVIAKELSATKEELSKTKHGPHILKNLGIDRYMRWPEQWRLSQASKEAIYQDFQATFGSQQKDTKSLALAQAGSSHGEKRSKGHKRPRPQEDSLVGKPDHLLSAGVDSPCLDPMMAKLGFSNFKHTSKGRLKAPRSELATKHPKKKLIKSQDAGDCFVRRGKKRKKSSELANLASKKTLSSNDVRKLFDSSTLKYNKKHN